ncbi:MAG: hypothetical protein AABX59_03930 [Nanoarchaeota archaeon]
MNKYVHPEIARENALRVIVFNELERILREGDSQKVVVHVPRFEPSFLFIPIEYDVRIYIERERN